jgi:two-component system phosphate regulon sensor histidine kinase PhoR
MFVFLLVIGATAITLQVTVHRVWERTLREQIERNLQQKTLMFAHRVETDRQHSLADITSQEGQAAGARATVIDPTGKVLADSEADPSTMENHAQRPEFVSALGGKVGMDERNSRTLSVPLCTWRRRFLGERCGWRIRCRRSKLRIVRWARPCSGDR